MIRIVGPGLLAVVFAAISHVMTPSARGEGGEASQFAPDFDRLLAFVGGSELRPSERARIESDVVGQLRADAPAIRRADAATRVFLGKLPTAEPWFLSDRREALRAQIEMLPANDPAREIVDAHDPTIVFDRAHRRIVSERSLLEWRRAFAWLANEVGVPGPGSAFVDDQRRFVRTRYASLPDARQHAVAHVERDYPAAVYVFAHADRAKLQAALRAARGEATDRAALPMDVAVILSESYDTVVDQLLIPGILATGASNFNMLYHRGYDSGNYR